MLQNNDDPLHKIGLRKLDITQPLSPAMKVWGFQWKIKRHSPLINHSWIIESLQMSLLNCAEKIEVCVCVCGVISSSVEGFIKRSRHSDSRKIVFFVSLSHCSDISSYISEKFRTDFMKQPFFKSCTFYWSYTTDHWGWLFPQQKVCWIL